MPSDATPALLRFTTGPTRLHPRVPAEIEAALAEGLPSWSHRSPEFRREVERCREALAALLGMPDGWRVLLVGSASEAMERIIQGVRPESSLHLLNGAFARRFRDIAGALGVATRAIKVDDGRGFGAEAARRVQADLDDHPGTGLVALTQNETSTGVRIPSDVVHEIGDVVRASGALVAVDLVSGWPVEPVDPARIDAGFLSVQKAFGLPAGLGVIVASPALVERSRRLQREGRSVGGYFHLPALADAADRNETVATPNMLAVRLLGRVAEHYLAEGLDSIRAATDRRAAGFWQAIEDLPGIHPFVAESGERSRTILVVDVDGGSAPLRSRLQERGIVTSDGYGRLSGRHLRVANFPMHTDRHCTKLIRALQLG